MALLIGILLMCVGVTKLTFVNAGVDIGQTSVQEISGQRVEVATTGRLTDIIYLDVYSSIKKLKCEKNKIILIGKDDSLGRNWTEGQIIVGGPKWECFLNSLDPDQKGIYGVVTHVSFANHRRINVFMKKISSLDLFENTTTFSIRSRPSNTKQSASIQPTTHQNASVASQNVGTFLNRFSTRPFHLIKLKDGDDLVKILDDDYNNSNISGANMDLSVKVSNCETRSNMAFDMELIIAKDPEGISRVKSFYNQVNVSLKSLLELKTEIFNKTAVKNILNGFQPNSQEFLTVPLTNSSGLPSIVLQITVQPESSLNFNVFAAPGRSHVTTVVKSAADYTTVMEYENGNRSRQEVKVTDWQLSNETRVQADAQQDMKMLMQFSHRLKFTAHLGLFMDKMYPLHTFPIEISSNPNVEVESKAAGPVRSTKITSKLSASVATTFVAPQHDDNSTETNIEQQKIESQEVTIGEQILLHLETAECHRNGKTETDQSVKMTDICAATYSRNTNKKSNLKNLIYLLGDDIVFMSELTNGTWCQQQGRKCQGCFRHSVKNSKTNQCPDRLVTPRLALRLSKLVLMSRLTWPNRKLIVLKSWTEAPPANPAQLPKNKKDSLFFEEARAIQIGISKPIDANPNPNKGLTLDKSPTTLDALGKLALCADFQYVRQVKTDAYLELAVCMKEAPGKSDSSSETEEEISDKKMFMTSMNATSSDIRMCDDLLNKPFPVGSTFPENMTADEVCGPVDVAIDRTNTKDYSSLYVYPFNDVKFESEGQSKNWCGSTLRRCRDDCSQASARAEPWQWCNRRVMSRRLASRLRELSRLMNNWLQAKKPAQKTAIKVLMSHKEASEYKPKPDQFHPLYTEGRGLRLTTTANPGLYLQQLSLLAICASFDYVSYSNHSFIEVFVKKQAGWVANEVDFLGQSLLVVQPPFSQSQEYDYPRPLQSESGASMLFDGSNKMTNLSPNFKIKDFLFSNVRYFRLDPQILTCLERVKEAFPEKFHITPNGAYRSSTANLLNLYHRHIEELHRFQAGKAVELTTKDKDSNRLLLLAETVIRQCSPSLRAVDWSLGIGLHSSSIYVDLRPQNGKRFVKIWNTGGNNETFRQLKKFSDAAHTGGSLISSTDLEEACKKPILGEDFYYLSLYSEGIDFCINNNAKEEGTCKITQTQREKEATKFKERLISAAGASAMGTSDIMVDTRKCLVDNCGGCSGSGTVWLRKSQACSQLLRTFVKKASMPFPNLHNTVAFFSSTNANSLVHHLACEQGSICIETIPLYAVIEPLLDSKYNVEESETVEELLFGGDDNPSPLLEILEQELAMRASGKVIVFLETDKDVDVLRNVLKILMIYNNKIDNVKFYISKNVTETKISASLRRKLDVWSSSTCPRFSRVAVTPFSISKIPTEKLRRSAEKSKARNERKIAAQNWEIDWLESL
ncbi:LOW QUALITY PROTEIN: uncharacterized protein LOC115224777 [Octopus sinensis]|uniref:LOW QUALITY PROTEIN: uncharacterized protein LOC115224777 n=1 Tax=Octopus sinensis TaxID=2607531 RepID=A0A6P7TQB4_9MOLL|nr:LOW QUALITY PROTEIN: uncharacterized protein LOC115224777 [Octopus sinensis]